MSKKKRDQILIGAETAPGQREAIRRYGDDVFEEGVFMEVKEGQPIPAGADFIDVKEPDAEGWSDVDVLYSNRSGPAQVTTPEYRKGHDRIFGKKQTVGLA